MVQEFYILRCFECNKFQVHIVKKATKWCCKVCGTKQSVSKIYGQGTSKECRLQVQKLNMLAAEKNIGIPYDSDVGSFEGEPKDESLSKLDGNGGGSKWDNYLDRPERGDENNYSAGCTRMHEENTSIGKYSQKRNKSYNRLHPEDIEKKIKRENFSNENTNLLQENKWGKYVDIKEDLELNNEENEEIIEEHFTKNSNFHNFTNSYTLKESTIAHKINEMDKQETNIVDGNSVTEDSAVLRSNPGIIFTRLNNNYDLDNILSLDF